MKGVLSSIVIVAQWKDRAGRVDGVPDSSYALACTEDAYLKVRDSFAMRGVPEWVVNAPRDDGVICAVGACGPTIDPRDQEKNVIDEAKNRLAEQLTVEITAAKQEGVAGPMTASVQNIPQEAIDRAQAAPVRVCDPSGKEPFDGKCLWKDDKGRGPVQEPGFLYAVVCAPK